MNASYDKSAAVVVLPAAGGGRLTDRSLQSWLVQSDLVRVDTPVDTLERLLREIDRTPPDSGHAALRLWGQTRDRPTTWIAAADPVYLEPRLDRLCLHALDRGRVDAAELKQLVDHLQSTLGSGSGYGFIELGGLAYVNCGAPIATADMPPSAIDGAAPDDYMPPGKSAAAYRMLRSEIEMALHEHPVNVEREARGLPPVNSLWIWGGGQAPERVTEPHPPLFSDDPLPVGYWRSKTGVSEPWPGNIRGCLDVAVAGFAASVPETAGIEVLESCLHELRDALQSDRLSKLTLLFRDGLRAEVRRGHALRIWRRRNTLLEESPGS